MSVSELIPVPPNQRIIAAREFAGFTRADVAVGLNLPVAIIEALEDGRYEFLYGDAFIIGVFRTYANFLGINPDSCVEAYKLLKLREDKIKMTDAVCEQRSPLWKSRQIPDLVSLDQKYRAVCGIVLIAVLALLIRFTSIDDVVFEERIVDTTIAIDTAVGTTIVSSLDAMPVNNPAVDLFSGMMMFPLLSYAQPIVYGGVDAGILDVTTDKKNRSSLDFLFSADCWVEILDGDNQKIYSSMQRANERLELTGKPPFRITLGYAPGVVLSYNSQIIPINTDNTHVAKLVLGNS